MQQRLLTRYWLLVGLTVILLILALAVSNRLVVSTLVERQERVLTHTLMRQFNAVMSERLDNLSLIGKDWAFWDDSYRFMTASLPEQDDYLPNLSDDSLSTLRVDLIALLTPSATIHAARLRQADGSYDLPEPGALSELLRHLPPPGSDAVRTGLVAYNGMAAELVVAPIFDSDRNGPSRGWLLMLRLINPPVLDRLSRQLELPLDLRLAPTSSPYALTDLVETGRFSSQPLNARLLAASLHFRGLDDEQGFAATLVIPRHLRATALDSAELLSALTIAIVMLAFVALGILVNRLLVQPLSQRIRTINRLDLNGALTPLDSESSLSEVATLSTTVNQLLNRFDAIRQELRLTLAAVGDAVLTVHGDGRIDYANPAALALLGLSQEQAVGHNLFVVADIWRSDEQQPHPPQLLLQQADEPQRQLWRLRRGEQWLYLNAVASGAPGLPVKVLVLHDVTAEVLSAHALKDQASHDPLTGLLNRRAFDELLNRIDPSQPQPGCLLMIDIDHFKPVNDRFGHSAGDQALCAIAAVLSHGIRKGDAVARLGGDEFAVLLFNCNRTAAARVAEQIRHQIAAIRIDSLDQPLGISASIGWCEIHSRDPQQLINNADRACYTAKARGRNTCVDFHSLNDRG